METLSVMWCYFYWSIHNIQNIFFSLQTRRKVKSTTNSYASTKLRRSFLVGQVEAVKILKQQQVKLIQHYSQQQQQLQSQIQALVNESHSNDDKRIINNINNKADKRQKHHPTIKNEHHAQHNDKHPSNTTNDKQIKAANTGDNNNNNVHEVKTCRYIKKLIPTISRYQQCINQNNKENQTQCIDDLSQQIIEILNMFNHILHTHDNDEDFEYIHGLLPTDCILNECKIIKRNRRNRNILQCENEQDEKADKNSMVFQEISDIIHCHFLHSYHLGYRLTNYEKNDIYNKDIDEEKENVSLKLLHQLIQDKRKNLHKVKDLNSDTIDKPNKFISNSEKSSKTLEQYSYGFKFFYWDYYKHTYGKQQDIYYVPAKYDNLKEELSSNKISTISMQQFNMELHRARLHEKTAYSRSIQADIEKYSLNNKRFLQHPYHYGFNDCYKLSLKHLVCIIIYCSYDTFQALYSSTNRKKDSNETMGELIKRNSNFHHFSKYLLETVNIFGMQQENGKINTFYHGIHKQMVFQSTAPFIHGPLSTTSSFEVAVNFTNNNQGVILQLNPTGSLKYFSCSWLSAYSNESEYLFIGGLLPFTFVNIINANIGCEYKQYIKAISVIDSMTNGCFFDDDKTIFATLRESDHWNPSCVGAKPLDDTYKRISIKLIKNEMNNEKDSNLDEYINNLFHHICINKRRIFINWESLNVEISNVWNHNGYIGYLFLKHIFFCSNKYQSLNFIVINQLYPNLAEIEVIHLPFIDVSKLEIIWQFLQQNTQSQIAKIQLTLAPQTSAQVLLSMHEAINSEKKKFQSIGFVIEQFTVNNGCKATSIRKLKSDNNLHDGYLPNGNNIEVKKMTIKKAIHHSSTLPNCTGFTFKCLKRFPQIGDDETFQIYFKQNYTKAVPSNMWLTYLTNS